MWCGCHPLGPLLQAATVVALVEGLLGSGSGVRVDDIGVMATYRLQVKQYSRAGRTTC